MVSVDAITIKSLRSIASIEGLQLRSLNVRIGANGSGKSNLPAALDLLREIREGRLEEYVIRKGGAEPLLRFGSRQTARIELGAGNGDWSYSIDLNVTGSDERIPDSEKVFDQRAGG